MNLGQWIASAEQVSRPSRPIDLRLPMQRSTLHFNPAWARKFLAAMERLGPATRNDIARAMKCAQSFTRVYLAYMHTAGIVTYEDRLRRGRPCHFWHKK